MTRIALACFEVPGWGGLTTATYRLFEKMLAEGMDVHYVNLVLADEVTRFRNLLGAGFENPRSLPNVVTCRLRGALHEPHPELTALVDAIAPDRIVSVGDIAAYLMKQAAPQREVIFLTAGCMQVDRNVPVTEQLAGTTASGLPFPDEWKEREAMRTSDLVLTHSGLVRDLFLRFYPEHAGKIRPEVISFAEWIVEDTREHAGRMVPFEERDIDALFIASSWTRMEKNYGLLSDIAANVEGMSVHVVGEFDSAFPSAVHHGFIGDRATLFQLMGRARSVVCPSTFDAAPGILFEGSAMGCNVIASRNCGNWELCNDRLLVTDYTTDAFAEAIRRARAAKLPDNLAQFLWPSSYEMLKRVLR
jgi:glycosyltransferase involved in cell wall biosynthesis